MSKREKPPPHLIPKATVERLSLYLRHLERVREQGQATISSQQLGDALGVTAAQVRKDLGYFGQFGYPGVGYKVPGLIAEIRRILGTDRTWKVALVGIGNLGSALARYRGFEAQGFAIAALFDNSPRVVGQEVAGKKVRDIAEMGEVIAREGIQLGIITVPAPAAQEVADRLVEAGIRGIFNFAPAVITVPERIACVSIDLAVQLEQLTFYVTHIEVARRTEERNARREAANGPVRGLERLD